MSAASTSRVTDPARQPGDINPSLRPQRLVDYIGQPKMIQRLDVALRAARSRQDAMPHCLFHGGPGLGKSSICGLLAKEMKSRLHVTSGPALERTADLLGTLTMLGPRDVLFIDEIHRLPATIEEFLYPAMEDFKVDFVVDKGMSAKTVNVPLARFTLVAATTSAGKLSAPLRDRFGMVCHLDYYSAEDLTKIVVRSASILGVVLDATSAAEIATRSRGTPRIANRLVQRVRDWTQAHQVAVSPAVIAQTLELEGIDADGLDDLDRRYLLALRTVYKGGPAGVEALAASLNESPDTLVDMVEPFLLQKGFISRTKRGRMIV